MQQIQSYQPQGALMKILKTENEGQENEKATCEK
jgi:hypothetical protein